MKMINYRGLVRFRIPEDWVEEYEDVGGGTFYLDEDDTPTLRLNVLTFESPKPFDTDQAPQFLQAAAKERSLSIDELASGCSMIAYQEERIDQGEPIFMNYWQLCRVVPPRFGRMAVFSLTTLASQMTKQAVKDTLAILDLEIRGCSVSTEPSD